MAFMFVRTETAFAYTKLFTACKERCKMFFGGDLELRFDSRDHCDAIANAFKEVWPDIALLHCWPHFFCKA
jgi:hypothetical protein